MSSAPVAEAIRRAAASAVEAARRQDLSGFERAAGELAAHGPEPVGLVLGGVLRMLLEESHPDGLAGEDMQGVLRDCVRAHTAWLPGFDPAVLVVVLTGALGVHPSAEEMAPVEPAAVARHAPLLVADLLTATGRPIGDYLEAALADIAISEGMELP